MKENKYDDGAFFEKYSQMPRSVHGLSGAGEWEALRKMFPDFDGKRVLDLGCGFGWHCMYAAECGALSVIGSDISSKMLNVATEKNFFPDNVRYKCAPMEDLNFESGSFDVVMSSLAFHYIPDFAAMTAKISNWLVCGGDFIFQWSIRFLRLTDLKIGFMMKTVKFFIFHLIDILKKDGARLCF